MTDLEPIHWQGWALIAPDGSLRRVYSSEELADAYRCGDEELQEVKVFPIDTSVPASGGSEEPATDEIRYPVTEFIDGKLTVTGYEVIAPEEHAEHSRHIAEVDAGFYWTLLDGWMVPSEKLYARDKRAAHYFGALPGREPETGT